MEQINWHFTSSYYPYLAEKVKMMDRLLQMQRYGQAFTEMHQVYCHWTNPIRKYYAKKRKENLKRMKELIKKINDSSLDFDRLLVIHDKSRPVLLKMAEIKFGLKSDVYEFYGLLFEALDDIGVLAPKTNNSGLTPEDEFDDKYIKPFEKQ